MKSGPKIAVSGKGGVGKTTICAGLATLIGQDGLEVLAIDADSNPNLALAFGVPLKDCPAPLIEMKELIQERTGAKPGSLGQYFKLNPEVSDLPEKYCLKVGNDGVRLLVLGGIQWAGSGCACPESALLKSLLTHITLQREEAILVDLDAGVEFMGRASVQGIDALIIVVEPSGRSIETVKRIVPLARQMGINNIAAVANKITDADQIEMIKSQMSDLTFLGGVQYNSVIQRADFEGKSVAEADHKLMAELALVKTRLFNLLNSDK